MDLSASSSADSAATTGPDPAPRPSMRNPPRPASNAGLSYIELVVVIVVIGIMVLVALPKLGPAYDHAMVRGARTAVTNLYNATRTASRSSNKVAVLKLSDNVMWIELNPLTAGGIKDTVRMGGTYHDLEARYGVTVTGPDSIRMDPRGLLDNTTSQTFTWVVTRDGWSDSIMVNSYGRMIR